MHVTARMMTIAGLLASLQLTLGTNHFVDKTGLTDTYDFKFQYSSSLRGRLGQDPNDTNPDLFTALEKQLGLKLQKTRTSLAARGGNASIEECSAAGRGGDL